jgi:hypothetical protein
VDRNLALSLFNAFPSSFFPSPLLPTPQKASSAESYSPEARKIEGLRSKYLDELSVTGHQQLLP